MSAGSQGRRKSKKEFAEPTRQRENEPKDSAAKPDIASLGEPGLTVAATSYLKAAWKLTHEVGIEWIGATRLAKALGVTSGAVASMLKTLAKSGLVDYKPYVGIRLTPIGNRLAANVVRRHRLLETFLVDIVNVPWDRVHEEAERMEHGVSDFVLDGLDAILSHPTHDPHGDPIPRPDGTMPEGPIALLPANDLEVGCTFRFRRVINQDADFLRHLSACGLLIGVVAQLESRNAVAGTITLRVNDRRVVFSEMIASHFLAEAVCPS